MKQDNPDHIIATYATCPCDKTLEEWERRCPTCDWGLDLCLVCGRAEIELSEPCEPKTPPREMQ